MARGRNFTFDQKAQKRRTVGLSALALAVYSPL
jgi:hypothetical protein